MTKMFKSSRTIKAVVKWIVQAARDGQPVPAVQVRTWAEALITSVEEIEKREMDCFLAEDDPMTPRGSDRIAAAEAEFGVRTASALIAGLARLATRANPEDAKDIDQMACSIVGTLEALAHGVTRPEYTETQPLKGA